jgi:hypothetical protein
MRANQAVICVGDKHDFSRCMSFVTIRDLCVARSEAWSAVARASTSTAKASPLAITTKPLLPSAPLLWWNRALGSQYIPVLA